MNSRDPEVPHGDTGGRVTDPGGSAGVTDQNKAAMMIDEAYGESPAARHTRDKFAQRVALCYQNVYQAHFAMLALWLAALMFYAAASRSHWFTAWLLALPLYVVLSFGLIRRYVKASPPVDEATRWAHRLSVHHAVLGTLWGLFPLVVNSANADFLVDLQVLLVAAPWFGAAALTAALPRVFLAWTVPQVLILGAVLWRLDDRPMLALVALAFVVALIVAVNLSDLIGRAIALRFENLDLARTAAAANREKSFFLAAASHDLRQPMHALSLFLQAAKQNIGNARELEMLLGKATASCQALSELFNALMDVSRLDAGEVRMQARLMDLGALAARVVSEFEPLATERGICIETQLQPTLVRQDPLLVQRMLRNLLSNAIKHNRDCRVQVSTWRKGQRAWLEVCDLGKGIPENEIDNIFCEFYQVGNPERDRRKGLGMGLAIVRRLAELTGVKVQASSRAGRGSCFSLDMELADGDLPDLPQAVREDDVDLTGVFVVIIDDESDVREAVKILLRGWGCETLLADTQDSLLEELKSKHYPPPDLLICDYRLGQGRTGLEALQAVRGHFDADVPAVLVTGDSSRRIARQAQASGCRLLLKPLGGAELRRTIVATVQSRVSAAP